MNFRSYCDLLTTLALWQEKLPRDFTLLCGVPRSGLMVANILALQWHLPVSDVANLAAGRVLGGGQRLGMDATALDRFLEKPQRILVVEDSVAGGAGIRDARSRLASLATRHDIKFAAVYAAPQGRSEVDFAAEVLMVPRIFEWNLFNHSILPSACLDIDGVLCRDPSNEENDDGPRYREFLRTAAPRYLPSREVGWLVTSRLEKYRTETEEWLRHHGVQYRELCMLGLPDKRSRQESGAGVRFKAEQYRRTAAKLFIESDSNQAVEIANLTGNHVIATDSMQLVSPDGIVGHTLRARQNLSARAVSAKSWPRRALRFARRYFDQYSRERRVPYN